MKKFIRYYAPYNAVFFLDLICAAVPGDIHFIMKLPDKRPIINNAIPPNASIREASTFVISGFASVT